MTQDKTLSSTKKNTKRTRTRLSPFLKRLVSVFSIKPKIIWLWSKLSGMEENYIKDELYSTTQKEFWSLILNTIITGTLIWFSLNYFNNPLSYGIIAFLSQYYIGWFIDKIKERQED